MSSNTNAQYPIASFLDVLAELPPGVIYSCPDLRVKRDNGVEEFNSSPIRVYCRSPECQDTMWFDRTEFGASRTLSDETKMWLLVYRCRHCHKGVKRFAITGSDCPGVCLDGLALKFGEWPPFGPPLPERLLKMAGRDRELWLKGRTCENQGLGIAAFAYCRRVVEARRSQLLDLMIKVCDLFPDAEAKRLVLERAKSENQFSKAMDLVKDAIPVSLYIRGQNPLTLLHGVLSEGLHAQTDEDCLVHATAIRTVMARMTELVEMAIADDAELTNSLSALNTARQPAKKATLDPEAKDG